MPSAFVFALNAAPFTFSISAHSDRFMVVMLPILSLVTRGVVIHEQLVVLTRDDQKLLYVSSGCNFFLAIVFGGYFQINKFDFKPDAHPSNTTPQFLVLALLILQVIAHSFIRLRATEESVLERFVMPWRSLASSHRKFSFNELRVLLVKASFWNAVGSVAVHAAKFVLVNYLVLSQILMVLIGLISSAESSLSRVQAAAIAIGVIPLIISGVLLLVSLMKIVLWVRHKLATRAQRAQAKTGAAIKSKIVVFDTDVDFDNKSVF
jgi:hypothetical protein